MSAKQLNELWTIVRDNEKTLAVLAASSKTHGEEIRKLTEDNERIKAIINKAIGAKTFAGVIGAIVGALFTALVTLFASRH